MVEKDAFPDFCAGMDIGLKYLGGPALQIKGYVALSGVPKPMRKPVRLDRGVALEE